MLATVLTCSEPVILDRVVEYHKEEYKDHCQQSKILYWIPDELHGSCPFPAHKDRSLNDYRDYDTNTCQYEYEQDIEYRHEHASFCLHFACHVFPPFSRNT